MYDDFQLNDSNKYYPLLLRLAKEMGSSKEIDFTNSNTETLLFYAMRGFKPVGVNRHFMMACIHQKFTSLVKREISSQSIWDHLDSLYDMETLHESEIVPFPLEELDFELSSNFIDGISQAEWDAADEQDGREDMFKEENENEEGYTNYFKDEDSENECSDGSTNKNGISKVKAETPVSSSKNIFATPTSSKSVSSTIKSEIKSENSIKKPDASLAAKFNKVKRSSSPLVTKNSASEQTSSSKEQSPTISSTSKKVKSENNTSVSTKKTPKIENSASKKSAKQNHTPKHSKPEISESSSKKLKSNKEPPSKKAKVMNTPDHSTNKKNSHADNKKFENETPRRTSDASSKAKTDRASSVSSKGSRQEDSDSSVTSSSRKSSVKNDINDKKKKKSPVKRKRT